MRPPPTGPAQICGRSRPPRRAHPHPPAGGRGGGTRAAGAGTGRRRRAARCALCHPAQAPGSCRPGATAPRARRLRVGIPVKWPRADRPRADHGCGVAAVRSAKPQAERTLDHPPASQRRTARVSARLLGRRSGARFARFVGRLRPSERYRPAHLRHWPAGPTLRGRRCPGGVAARRRAHQLGWPSQKAPVMCQLPYTSVQFSQVPSAGWVTFPNHSPELAGQFCIPLPLTRSSASAQLDR